MIPEYRERTGTELEEYLRININDLSMNDARLLVSGEFNRRIREMWIALRTSRASLLTKLKGYARLVMLFEGSVLEEAGLPLAE